MTYVSIAPEFVCYSAAFARHHVDRRRFSCCYPLREIRQEILILWFSALENVQFSVYWIYSSECSFIASLPSRQTLNFADAVTGVGKNKEIYEKKIACSSGVVCRSGFPRCLLGIVGSNPSGVCLCLLSVVRKRSLRRADHSSRGVLPTLVCLSVIVKPR